MNFETIETERLLLRKVTPEVYDFIYQQYSDDECIAFLGLSSTEELALEKDKHRKGLSAYDRTFLYFQLIHKTSNELMGMCGFVRHYPAHQRAEFGYSLFHDRHKNKGYMSEATAPIMEYGFQKMKLHRVEAMVGSNNEPSLKIIKKLGFTWEGLMKAHYLRDGIFEDSEVFGLLNQ